MRHTHPIRPIRQVPWRPIVSGNNEKIVILPEETAAASPVRPPFSEATSFPPSAAAATPPILPVGGWGGRSALVVGVGLTILLVSIVLIAAVASVGPGMGGARANILAVLRADQELARERESSVPASAGPIAMAAAVGRYCDRLESLDMSGCPADFRVAFRHHIGAWREVQAALQQYPDGFLQGLLVGAVNGMLRGEQDGGQSRLEGALRTGLERVRDTWIEVEKIGAAHGAVL